MKEIAAKIRDRIRGHFGPVLLWTLLCVLFFLTLLIGRERLPSSDFSGQFHAFGLFQAQELSQGRLPLWSPGSYGGFPFAADTQSAAFYPLRWLTILLSLPWGFSFYALELEAILHIWLGGLFTYALSYSMTRQRPAGLVSAVAFGLGGYLTSFPLLQLAVLETIIWLPLVLLLLRLGVGRSQMDSAGRSAKYLIGAGVILGVSFLAGHPQTFMHAAYLSAAYYLFLTVRAGWGWRWILGLGAVVAGVTGGIAAVSWLPAAHLTRYTSRSEVSYDFVSSGLPMLDYLQLLVPGVLSFWIPEYLGLGALVLALFAWRGRGYAGRGKAEIVFWAAAAVLAAWLALGDAGILFRLVYRLVPGFSLFRQQERLLALVSLALALLAGQGAALWFQLEVAVRRRLLLKTGQVMVVGLAMAAVVLALGSQLVRRSWLEVWLRQIAFLVPLFLLLWAGRPQRRYIVALVLLLAVDLYGATYEGVDRQAESPQVYWPEPPWLEELQAELAERPLARIDSRNLFHANLGPIYGLEDLHGISPLKLSWLTDFERLPQARHWTLMGVSHILAYGPPEAPTTLLGEIEEGLIPERPIQAYIYRFEQALPRAWMSYRPQTVESPEEALALLADPAFDPAAEVVLHTPVPGSETITQPNAPPIVETVRPAANRLQISVETAAPGLLVISEWRYPGWQATLDGQEVELYPADYALQAVLVPAGSHIVELRFRPLDVMVGGILSVATLLGAGFFLFGRQPVGWQRPVPTGLRPIPIPALPNLWSSIPDIRLSRFLPGVLIGLFLLAFWLRVHHLGVQELRGDEAFSYTFATLPLADLLPALTELGDVHTPFHYLLLHIWIDLAGDSEFAMRYLSLIPAVLAMPLLFVLGRRLAGTRPSLLFILFLSLSQSLVWLSQDVRNQYMLAVFFLALSTLQLVRAAARPSWGRWLAYSLLCVLAMYSHYYSFFALVAHGFYIVALPVRRRPFGRWLLAGGVAAIFFLPWVAVTISGVVGHLSEPTTPELADYLTTVGRELAAGPAFDGPLNEWLLLLAAFLAGLGWWRLRLKRPEWAALLGGWVAFTIGGIFLILLRRTIFNAYYILVAAPAWWLLVSLGLFNLGRPSQWGRWSALVVGVILIGASAVSLGRYYSDPLVYGRSSGLRPLTEHIAEQWQPGDVVVGNFPDPSITYYLRQVPVPQTLQPAVQGAERQVIETDILNLSSEYDRLWFIPESDSLWDPENIAFDWLDYHTLIEEAVIFDERSLFAYRPSHAVEAVMTPVGAVLDERLTLAGFYTTLNGRPLEAAETVIFEPGDELAVTLIWEGSGPISDNYTVFVHLLNDEGGLIAQHDGVPLFGTRPTTTWEAGERLLDRHTIQISAETTATNGRLVTGMYLVDDSGTIIPQLFDGAQSAIWLK